MSEIPLNAEVFDTNFGPPATKVTHFMNSLGFAERRHRDSVRFHELLGVCGDLHDKKQSDYGREGSPFANIEASEEWGIEAWVGSMVRLNDKVRRLQKVANGGRLENEGVFDSFLDIAVYALIAYVEYEKDHPLDSGELGD